jgi:outer membrane lipoprotein-sorting protein
MFKKSMILLFALFLIGSQAKSETVDEIIAKNIKAHGGQEKFENMETYQLEMKMNMMGMSIPSKIFTKKPDKMRMEMSMMGQEIITVINGDKAWLSQGGSVMELPEDQMAQVKDQMEGQSNFFENQFINYKEKGMDITLQGTEELDGKNYFKLLIVDEDNSNITMFIDTETYLEYKMIANQQTMGGETEMEIYMKNNKWVNGILIAHKIEMKSGGEPAGEIILENFKINEPIDDSIFILK